MRRITLGLFIVALMVALTEPAIAGRQGVPGRRVGGGTRWTAPRLKQPPTPQAKLNAMMFASRVNLPPSLRLKALYS